VIDMQVSADNGVDRLRGESGRGEVREERPVLMIELRDQRTFLRVARTSVDDDPARSGLHDKAVKAHQVPAVSIDEVRHEPRRRGGVGLGRLREEVEGEGHDVLDHPRDTHAADVPGHLPNLPSMLSTRRPGSAAAAPGSTRTKPSSAAGKRGISAARAPFRADSRGPVGSWPTSQLTRSYGPGPDAVADVILNPAKKTVPMLVAARSLRIHPGEELK
jgi:hypothetical protein